MAPSRTWPSTKGSIIPCSRAMRRIQRSDLMDMLSAGQQGSRAAGRGCPAARIGAQYSTDHLWDPAVPEEHLLRCPAAPLPRCLAVESAPEQSYFFPM